MGEVDEDVILSMKQAHEAAENKRIGRIVALILLGLGGMWAGASMYGSRADALKFYYNCVASGRECGPTP